MVKKGKTGKERLDKFYQLAKDHGYRARSAFKLIQLAKKFDFLSKSRVCIDLCAAPGGWSQVAQRNMPSGSQILAIDLAPIRAIQGVTCIQSDITSDKCRSILKRELKGNAADVVLHDGAPNVGAAWAKDAYGQAELTLHSMRLACEHLRPGGTFVTKVFRSADYNSLLWVFNQLFNKVDATKPTASRNVSAEIFVICSGFKNAKIDPRFFDPKWVFMETVNPDDDGGAKVSEKKSGAALSDLLKAGARRHRNGYEPGDDLRITPAHEFLASKKPAETLVTSHRLNLEAPGSEELAAHPLTTPEIRELCADLKVLGKGDLSILMKWRIKYLRDQQRGSREKHKSDAAAAAAPGPSPGPEGSAKAAAPDPKSMLQQDVNEAIAGFLDEAAGKHGKAGADGKSEAGSDDAEDEDIENELAEQVEKRRREEKREAKKTMARQKKQEWRRKLSLDVTSGGGGQDMPELFRGNQSSVKALEDAHGTEKWALDSDQEDDSDAEGASEGSDDDSDEKLDRLARLEVDVAVAEELQRLRSEDTNRTKMQRMRKQKKETRRKKVLAAWAGEFGAFNEAIDRKASEASALRDQEDGDDEDDDDDDDDEEDGDAALSILRDAQSGGRSLALEDGAAGFDAEALRASADGPGAADEEPEGRVVEAGAAGESRLSKNDTSEEGLRAKRRADRWFSQDVFKGLEVAKPKRDKNAIIPLDRDSDSDTDGSAGEVREVPDHLLPQLPLTDKAKRQQKRKREKERAGRFSKKSKLDEEEAGPLEIAPLEAPQPLVRPGGGGALKPNDPQELAETLALGSLLVDSKKSRMDMIDAAYNRWTFDADEGLPDWFREEEEKNNKPELPITKELMAQFRAKLREINARPIRKVAEARNRKKRRLNKRLEKLRATAVNLSETPDMSEHAKARQMRRAVSKLARQDTRKVTTVAIKKGGGGNQMQKKAPKGAKTKVVDRRMKSDRRGERTANKRDKGRQKALAKRQQRRKKGKGGSGGGGRRSKESGGKNGTAPS